MTRHPDTATITRYLPCPTCDHTMIRMDSGPFVTCEQGHRTLPGRLVTTLALDESLRLVDAHGNLSRYDSKSGRGALVAVAS